MKNLRAETVGNNGNQLIEVLHYEGLLKDGQTAEDIAKIARPFMQEERHLECDSLWEDAFDRVEELGYKLKF